MPKLIGKYTEEHLATVCKDIVEKKTRHSTVLDHEAEARVPKFEIEGRLHHVALGATQILCFILTRKTIFY